MKARLLGTTYGISADERPRISMQVLALIEQLINLHKDSSDRPVTVPVQVIAGQ